MADYGLSQALTFKTNTGQNVDNIISDKIRLDQLSKQNQALEMARAQLFASDLEFQNGSNPFDSKIIKDENSKLLESIGRYDRENPDWMTNRVKSAYMKQLKQQYKGSDAVLRSTAYKQAIDQYQKYVQAAKENPSKFNLDQLEGFKRQIDNYHQTGNQDGTADTEGIKTFTFQPPAELMNLDKLHMDIASKTDPDEFSQWNNGQIGAFKGRVSEKTLDNLAKGLYTNHQSDYDYQYKNEPDKVAAIKNQLRGMTKTDVHYGQQDNFAKQKALIQFEHNLKNQAAQQGVSLYDTGFLNTDRIEPGPQILTEVFTSTPPNFYTDVNGNKVKNDGNFVPNGVMVDQGVKFDTKGNKVGGKRTGVKEIPGYTVKDFNWAKDQGYVWDPSGFSGDDEGITDFEIRPEHKGKGEITYITDKEGKQKPYFKLYSTAVVDGNLPAYKNRVDKGMAPKIRAMAGVETEMNGQGPQVGEVQDGYEYVGGDPSSQASWKKL